MNSKLVFGIVLPSCVILLLILIGSANTGFIVVKKSEQTIKYESLFVFDYNAAKIQVQTITINNNYFLPRRYVLPLLFACIIDKENGLEPKYSSVQFMQMQYENKISTPLYGDFFNLYPPEEQSIEVAANSRKEINIFVSPVSISSYSMSNATSLKYDELLIMEASTVRSSYNVCSSLTPEELASAVHISIIKPIPAPKPSTTF